MRQFTLQDLNRLSKRITESTYMSSDAGSVCELPTCTVEGCQDNQKVAAAIKQGNAQFVLSSEYKKLKTELDTTKSQLEEHASTIKILDKACTELRNDNLTRHRQVADLKREVEQTRGQCIVGRTDIEPVARRDSIYGAPIIVTVNGFNVEGVVGRSITKQTVEITVDALGDLLARLDKQADTIRSKSVAIEDCSKQLDTLQQTVVKKNQEIAGLSERNRVLQQDVSTNNTARIDAEQRAITLSRDLSDAYAEIRKLRDAPPMVRFGYARIAAALGAKEGEDLVAIARDLAEFKARGDVNRARRIDELTSALTQVRDAAHKDILSMLPIDIIRGIDWHRAWFDLFDAVDACYEIARKALAK